jgi:hypothetical protein
LAELQRRVSWVRSFEITPAAEAGCNTYYLFFGTGSRMGLRRMKDAMWKVDPEAGQAFRDSTLADHPVLFEHAPDLDRLRDTPHSTLEEVAGPRLPVGHGHGSTKARMLANVTPNTAFTAIGAAGQIAAQTR